MLLSLAKEGAKKAGEVTALRFPFHIQNAQDSPWIQHWSCWNSSFPFASSPDFLLRGSSVIWDRDRIQGMLELCQGDWGWVSGKAAGALPGLPREW